MKSEVNMGFIPKKIREIELIRRFEMAGLKHFHTTKTREIFTIPEHLDLFLIYNTDRVRDESFGAVSPKNTDKKGYYVTALQVFWLHQIFYGIEKSLVAFGSMIDDYLPEALNCDKEFQRRCLIVKKMDTFPLKAIVRGYLTNLEIVEYNEKGTVCGLKTPAGLGLGDKFPQALFTPLTKSRDGKTNHSIDFEQMVRKIGNMRGIAEAIQRITTMLYERASGIAFTRGIVISSSNIKMGTYFDEESDLWALAVTDEVFTPDSSMFALSQGKILATEGPLEKYKVFTELLLACKLEEFWKKDMRIDL